MFSIGFTKESFVKAEPDEEGIVGLLVLGSHKERFVAHLWEWSDQQYIEHWRSALALAISGKPSALVTDMKTPAQSSHLVWWPVWKVGDVLRFHNQLLFYEQHGIRDPHVNVNDLFSLIGEYRPCNDEGQPLSEWQVATSEVETFLRD